MICPCVAITATFPLRFPLRPEKINSNRAQAITGPLDIFYITFGYTYILFLRSNYCHVQQGSSKEAGRGIEIVNKTSWGLQ